MSTIWPARICSLLVVGFVTVGCKRVASDGECECECDEGAAEATPVTSVDITPLAVGSPAGSRVAALDIDGDGRDEVVLAGGGEVVVYGVALDGNATVRWRTRGPGAVTAITAGDVDGDGRDDLFVGWGAGPEHRDAPAVLTAYLSAGTEPGTLRSEVIATPATARAEFPTLTVTTLEEDIPGVLWAVFVSKFDVGAFFTTGGGSWQQRSIATMRMGAHWTAVRFAEGERPTLVVGRPYGDTSHSFGDVTEWSAEPTARRPVPSVRGVRSLAAVKVGAGERPLLCYGAGWHWRYGEQAKGILTCAHRGPGGDWDAQIVDELGGYEVRAIRAGDLDGDGNRELLALGADGLYAYEPTFTGPTLSGASWRRRTIAPAQAQFAVADIDGDGTDEIVTAGPVPQIFRLRPRAGSTLRK